LTTSRWDASADAERQKSRDAAVAVDVERQKSRAAAAAAAAADAERQKSRDAAAAVEAERQKSRDAAIKVERCRRQTAAALAAASERERRELELVTCFRETEQRARDQEVALKQQIDGHVRDKRELVSYVDQVCRAAHEARELESNYWVACVHQYQREISDAVRAFQEESLRVLPTVAAASEQNEGDDGVSLDPGGLCRCSSSCPRGATAVGVPSEVTPQNTVVVTPSGVEEPAHAVLGGDSTPSEHDHAIFNEYIFY
jgi:hypothetical protein